MARPQIKAVVELLDRALAGGNVLWPLDLVHLVVQYMSFAPTWICTEDDDETVNIGNFQTVFGRGKINDYLVHSWALSLVRDKTIRTEWSVHADFALIGVCQPCLDEIPLDLLHTYKMDASKRKWIVRTKTFAAVGISLRFHYPIKQVAVVCDLSTNTVQFLFAGMTDKQRKIFNSSVPNLANCRPFAAGQNIVLTFREFIQ